MRSRNNLLHRQRAALARRGRLIGASLPPPRPEPSPRMPALEIRGDYRRQRPASGASPMPAFPSALDTPQRHELPRPRHHARQEAARALFCRAIKAAPCLRSLALFGGDGWQDLHGMHDSRGPCSEKGPSLARYSRGAFPKGGLRRFSDTWRAYLANASSFWIHGGDMLPGRGAFSCPRPLLGCMKRKTCHELPPGNASGRNLAIASRPRPVLPPIGKQPRSLAPPPASSEELT